MLNRKKIKVFNKPLFRLLHFVRNDRGWGGFLLFIFLFPQVNNALHYFVIEHHFHEYSDEKQFNHNDKNHNCEQSIFKIPNALLFAFDYAEPKRIISFLETEKLVFISFYTKNFFNDLSDRGPPVIARRYDEAIFKIATLHFVTFAMTDKK